MKKSAFFVILALIYVFSPLFLGSNKKSSELEKIDPKQLQTELKFARWKLSVQPKIDKVKNTQMTRIISAAKSKNVAKEEIAGVMAVESGGNAKATGTKGDVGLMQMRPLAAQTVFADAKCINDPDCNVLKGAEYLKYLETHGFPKLSERLLAYNVGPSRAKELIRQGINPENNSYVQKVTLAMNLF